MTLGNLPLMARFITGGLVLAFSLAGVAQGAQLPARAPGLWQSTSSVTGPDGKPMAQAQNVITLTCVDPATDWKFLLSGQGRCSQLDLTGAGANYTIDGRCEQPGGQVTIHEKLDYVSNKTVQLNAVFTTSSGKMSVASSLQWQGPCVDGMQPGDEGQVVDGNFVKAGNINQSNYP
ncbi:MAG: DUF3617 family protein [Rhodospirillales bacterium]|nr:DUF3617 family protein [Rhodospirillales bacterium]